MCRIASIFLLQRMKGSMSGDASCHQGFSFLQGKAPKEIHAILTETLREHAPSYALLFLRWHYSPTRTFVSLMDFSQSALALTSPVLTLQYNQQFQRSPPLHADDKKTIRYSVSTYTLQISISRSCSHERIDVKRLSIRPHDDVRVLSSDNGWKNSMPFSYFLLSENECVFGSTCSHARCQIQLF